MANEYTVNAADLTAVADAIRAKTGTSEGLSFPDGFSAAIAGISTGAQVVMGTVTGSSTSTLTIAPGFEPTMAILTIAGNTKINGSLVSPDQSIKIIFKNGTASLKRSGSKLQNDSVTETLTTSYSNGSFVFTSNKKYLLAGTYDWMAAS